MNIVEAHKFSSKHRGAILKSEICGCFYCLELFPPDEITDWIDEDDGGIGQTALCPKCSVDSVVGSDDIKDLNKDFLRKMHEHWFSK
ncbi:MAG: hypothetical protein JSV97_13665 [candidate division WOR-3 bacterium]|nr:MAG: hypothetical protein JSV97_13665 [candidate division WOR-3 bacterium]